jgi:hypothetical protein
MKLRCTFATEFSKAMKNREQLNESEEQEPYIEYVAIHFKNAVTVLIASCQLRAYYATEPSEAILLVENLLRLMGDDICERLLCHLDAQQRQETRWYSEKVEKWSVFCLFLCCSSSSSPSKHGNIFFENSDFENLIVFLTSKNNITEHITELQGMLELIIGQGMIG